MADRRPWMAAAAVALGLFAAGSLWLGRGQQAVRPTTAFTPPPTETPPASASPPSTSPAPAAKRPRTPLPPPGTPVGQIADGLRARADSGDSHAACRLAMELLRCQRLEESKSIQWVGGPPDVSLEKRGNLEMADRYAEMQIRTIQLAQQCEALDPALVAQGPAYLAAAARAGEPEAMLRYAVGTHHSGSGLNFLSDPDFDRWRRDAPDMLLRAAQAGRMDAVHLLGFAYRSDSAPYAGLIPDDPVQAHAWTLVLSRLQGLSEPAFAAPDAATATEATALAAQWHQRYFAGAVVGRGFPLQPESLDMPMRPPEEVPFCE